jgi:hypothetical protein
VVYEAQLWSVLTKREKKLAMPLAEKHGYDLVAVVKKLCDSKDAKGKEFIKASRFATIKRKCAPYKEIYIKNNTSEKFANWYYEKHLLGYTYGKTLKDIFSEKRLGLMEISEAEELAANSRVTFIGRVDGKPYTGVSKKKSKYFKIFVGDETGSIKVMIFNDKMEDCKTINNGLPKENEIVIVKGRKMDEVVFADVIGVQDNKVYTKLADLKNDKKIEKNLTPA